MAYVMICNINLFISLYIVDHYLNIGLLELWSIVVCQIHIENRESDVWFGWYSQWLARLANIQTAIWFGFQRT